MYAYEFYTECVCVCVCVLCKHNQTYESVFVQICKYHYEHVGIFAGVVLKFRVTNSACQSMVNETILCVLWLQPYFSILC
jgi:hypothetical protein